MGETITYEREIRNMPDAIFAEEWTRPESERRYPYNDLLAEAMRRGYNTTGRQVIPATTEKTSHSASKRQ